MINTDNFSQVPWNFGKTFFTTLSEKTCSYIRVYSNFDWWKFFLKVPDIYETTSLQINEPKKVFSDTRNNKWMAPFRSLLNATHDTAGRYSVMLLSCASLLDTMEEIFRYFCIKW